MGGALISQAVLDSGVSEEFTPGGEEEVEYGEVPLQPMLFQDDVIHGANTVEKARLANTRIDLVIHKPAYDFNYLGNS